VVEAQTEVKGQPGMDLGWVQKWAQWSKCAR
jgi:hypothetical protein